MAAPLSTIPPPDPLVPANFGGWFAKVIETIRRSFLRLLIIQVSLAIVSELFFAMLDNYAVLPGVAVQISAIIVMSIVFFIFTYLAQVTSFVIATLDAAGEPASVGTALKIAGPRTLPLLVWSILSGIMTAIGFVLLVIPGIYLAIVFSASLIGVVTIERRNIGRCFQLVNRRFWPTAGRMLVFLTFIICLVVIISLAYATGGQNSFANSVLEWILSIIVGLFGVGVSVVTYAELRFHENPTALTPALVTELRHGTG